MRAFENCLVCGASTKNTHSARRGSGALVCGGECYKQASRNFKRGMSGYKVARLVDLLAQMGEPVTAAQLLARYRDVYGKSAMMGFNNSNSITQQVMPIFNPETIRVDKTKNPFTFEYLGGTTIGEWLKPSMRAKYESVSFKAEELEISVGDRVRSYDFILPDGTLIRDDCYMEGQVTKIAPVDWCGSECDHYYILVDRVVRNGEEIDSKTFTDGRMVFPPVSESYLEVLTSVFNAESYNADEKRINGMTLNEWLDEIDRIKSTKKPHFYTNEFLGSPKYDNKIDFFWEQGWSPQGILHVWKWYDNDARYFEKNKAWKKMSAESFSADENKGYCVYCGEGSQIGIGGDYLPSCGKYVCTDIGDCYTDHLERCGVCAEIENKNWNNPNFFIWDYKKDAESHDFSQKSAESFNAESEAETDEYKGPFEVEIRRPNGAVATWKKYDNYRQLIEALEEIVSQRYTPYAIDVFATNVPYISGFTAMGPVTDYRKFHLATWKYGNWESGPWAEHFPTGLE